MTQASGYYSDDTPLSGDMIGSSYYTPNYSSVTAAPNFSGLTNQQATQSVGNSQVAAAAADPFASQRAGYQTQLNSLIANPGSLTSSPYYQFALNQGLGAINRQGTVRSGNKLAQLMQYGTGLAGQQYGQLVNQLTPLTGATTGSPGTAGQILAGGYNRSQDQSQVGAAQNAYARQPAPSMTQPQAQPNPAAIPGVTGGYTGAGASSGLTGGYDPYGLNYAGSAGPSAGTGYIQDSSGTTTFGGGNPYGGTLDPSTGASYDLSPGAIGTYNSGGSNPYAYYGDPSAGAYYGGGNDTSGYDVGNFDYGDY